MACVRLLAWTLAAWIVMRLTCVCWGSGWSWSLGAAAMCARGSWAVSHVGVTFSYGRKSPEWALRCVWPGLSCRPGIRSGSERQCSWARMVGARADVRGGIFSAGSQETEL